MSAISWYRLGGGVTDAEGPRMFGMAVSAVTDIRSPDSPPSVAALEKHYFWRAVLAGRHTDLDVFGEIAAILLDLKEGVITTDEAVHELRVLEVLYPLPEENDQKAAA